MEGSCRRIIAGPENFPRRLTSMAFVNNSLLSINESNYLTFTHVSTGHINFSPESLGINGLQIHGFGMVTPSFCKKPNHFFI